MKYETGSGETTQFTKSKKWDVRWPSDDGRGRIVYELNGELQVLDTSNGASSPVTIYVPNDGLAMRPSRIAVSDRVEGFELSPKGERAPSR